MKITFLPLGNENAPSSRIRVFTLHRELVKSGISSFIGYNSDANIVFIQKRVNKEIFQLVLKAKSEGKFIIYDVDDFGDALDYCCSQSYFKKIINLADIITTDTNEHLKFIICKYSKNNVFVVPDAIDYFPENYVRPKQVNEGQLRVLWFGSIKNFTLFEKYVAALSTIPKVKIVVATAADDRLRSRYPHIELLPWSLDDFIEILQGCHLTCLMHDGTEIDKAKSNNKMITSIAWGVPAVVSNTPDYERTAREVGVEYALFSNVEQLKRAIEKLRLSEQRYQYLESAQSRVWEKYSPNVIKNIFLSLVQNCMKNIKESNSSLGAPANMTSYGIIGKILNYINCSSGKESYNYLLKRDYLKDWVNNEGCTYRMNTYSRQRKDGEQPLKSNPSLDEIKSILHSHSPDQVLEVGCGWGRIMEDLINEFDIEGCDVSEDMLQLCPTGLKVFKHDIALHDVDFLQRNIGKWDVIYTRGVMLYLMDVPIQINIAMNNMLMMAAKKIIIWEWPDVCDAMNRICPSDKFQYHPIEAISE